MKNNVLGTQRSYFAPDGRVLFVGCVDQAYGMFCVVYRDASRVMRRYLNRQLPTGKTIEDVQVFLDIFARTYGLSEAVTKN